MHYNACTVHTLCKDWYAAHQQTALQTLNERENTSDYYSLNETFQEHKLVALES